MTEGALVSIIIPVYNIKEYVGQCVESVIHQTYKNLEIILVDDGSTDSTGEICDRLGGQDERIQVLHKRNGGLSDARNAGYAHSKGEYVSFVDGDDFLHPRAIETLVANLESNHADISSGGVKREYEMSYERFVNIDFKEGVYCFGREEALIEMYAAAKYIQIMAWAKLYKRKLLAQISFPRGYIHEDMAVMYLLFQKADKIVATTDPVYYQNMRPGSITRSEYSRFRVECWYQYYKEPMAYFKSRNRKIYHAVQAGFLRDAIRYWGIARDAGDREMKRILMKCYRSCINRSSLKYLGMKKRFKVCVFAAVPQLGALHAAK